jgi:DNA helicase-2/ATP-dependent DNA helicase PcrA
MSSYLDKLNPDQRRAVEYGVAAPGKMRPLLVIAGAGSGKTTTLSCRVAHLVMNGVDPRRILLLTFSRRASAEMAGRVERMVATAIGANASSRAAAFTWSGTFHSIGARLLRLYAQRIGLIPSFTIHGRGDAEDLMNLVRHEIGFSKSVKRFPRKATCLAIYSRTVNSELPLGVVLAQTFPWCCEWERELAILFSAYVEAKQKQNVLDLDDLLLYWAQMMAEPSIGADVASRFDHVLVDEYQDTNRLQASILLGLMPASRGLTVVGDDAQAIYAFRGAAIRNILDFPEDFDAEVITLERNYRSTQPILAASNAVISLAAERYTKDLWSDRTSQALPLLVTVQDDSEQARYVVGRVVENLEAGIPLKTQAVLSRASSHGAAVELELARRQIPFVKFGGLKFLEAAHVKDVLACLRWAENPLDRVAGFRVIQLLPGFGAKTAERVLSLTSQPNSTDALAEFVPPARSADEWRDFVALIHQLSGPTSCWPTDLGCVRRWYEPQLDRLYDDATSRAADVAQFEQIAGGYPSRERFLTELTLDPPQATSGEAGVPLLDEDYLILSTIHSAKGQEWKAVFMINAVDGCIPSSLATSTSEEIEEERRLLYVAMTRAKDQLDIIVPHRVYTHQQATRGDEHSYTCRTRFLPDTTLPLFESISRPVADEPASAVCEPQQNTTVDIGARMRRMWGVA